MMTNIERTLAAWQQQHPSSIYLHYKSEIQQFTDPVAQ